MGRFQLSNAQTVLHTGPFEGVEKLRVVSCTADTDDSTVTMVNLFDPRKNTSLVYVMFRSNRCRTGSVFSSCDFDLGQRKVTLRVIISDLEDGEVRVYGCQVFRVSDEKESTYYYVNVSYTLPTTTTTTTTEVTPSTSESPKPSTSESPAPSTSESPGLHSDNSYFGLAIAAWVTLSLVLIVIIIVVIIVVVCLWRRQWKLSCAESGDPTGPNTQATNQSSDYLTPIPGPVNYSESGDPTGPNTRATVQSSDYLTPISGPVDYSGPYDSLRMADVGQRSVYSEITSGGNPHRR